MSLNITYDFDFLSWYVKNLRVVTSVFYRNQSEENETFYLSHQKYKMAKETDISKSSEWSK